MASFTLTLLNLANKDNIHIRVLKILLHYIFDILTQILDGERITYFETQATGCYINP